VIPDFQDFQLESVPGSFISHICRIKIPKQDMELWAEFADTKAVHIMAIERQKSHCSVLLASPMLKRVYLDKCRSVFSFGLPWPSQILCICNWHLISLIQIPCVIFFNTMSVFQLDYLLRRCSRLPEPSSKSLCSVARFRPTIPWWVIAKRRPLLVREYTFSTSSKSGQIGDQSLRFPYESFECW